MPEQDFLACVLAVSWLWSLLVPDQLAKKCHQTYGRVWAWFNTWFELCWPPQQSACPLYLFFLYEVWAIPFSAGWFIPTHPLFPTRSHKLSFKGRPLSKFIAYIRFFILERSKPINFPYKCSKNHPLFDSLCLKVFLSQRMQTCLWYSFWNLNKGLRHHLGSLFSAP